MSRASAGCAAQRGGADWENSVESANMGYAMQNVALVERYGLTGRYVKGKGFMPGHSPVDFVGDVKVDGRYYPVAFDCKSFKGDEWSFAEWNASPKLTSRRTKRPKNKVHQLVALRHMARFGGLAFVLVQQSRLTVSGTDGFGKKAWLVPLSVIESCIRKGQWSMRVAELDARDDKWWPGVTVRVRGADWMEAVVKLLEKELYAIRYLQQT